jgi:nicotinate-nucleotide adenylyltransferase
MEPSSGGGKRIAFFGGSFDPPHWGHLAVARAARAALELDTVLFAPVGAQPLKPQGATAGFEDRVAMTRLAIAGEPGFEVSLVDAPKALTAPNYTLDTLLRLRAQLRPEDALFFLMGADSFLTLRHWHRAAEIPFVASLIVASRPGQALDGLEAALPAGLAIEPLEPEVRAGNESSESPSGPAPEMCIYTVHGASGETGQLYLLPNLQAGVSATGVRSRIQHMAADSEPELGRIPRAVLDYIHEHGLYRGA